MSWPEGFHYEAGFLSVDEEATLLEGLRGLEMLEVRMHGVVARRKVKHFGLVYGYDRGALQPGPPLPAFLRGLQARACAWAGIDETRIEEVLVTHYPPGAGIGWHRDAPMFGSRVVGVSLLGPCRMRFQRVSKGVREVWAIEMEPRSVYLLSGVARWQWQHSIPAVRQDRWSITLRTLRTPR